MTTEETNPVDYARGVLQVEAETLRQERDELARTIEVILSALAGGSQWEIDTARHLARQSLTYLKDYP